MSTPWRSIASRASIAATNVPATMARGPCNCDIVERNAIPPGGIRATTQPATAWNKAAPQEYGFYSNVNPAVSHPRWSQVTERRIGELRKRPTQPFNGYADQVASLYQGMDLKKFY